MTKLAIALAAGLVGTTGAWAVTCDSGNLSASFSIDTSVAGTLLLTLTNTATCDVNDPPDVLTGMFFNYNGSALTPVSAAVAAGSVQVNPSAAAGTYVGNEWAYLTGLSVYGGTFDGIRSAGFGLPGGDTANFGCGGTCDNLDGLSYGILSSGDDTTTGNTPVTTSTLIKNAVTFTFSYTGAVPTLDNFSNIKFQYGTALFPDEPCIGCTQFVPETNSAAMLVGGVLLLMAAGLVKRFRRA
jgi:hypothetical protein